MFEIFPLSPDYEPWENLNGLPVEIRIDGQVSIGAADFDISAKGMFPCHAVFLDASSALIVKALEHPKHDPMENPIDQPLTEPQEQSTIPQAEGSVEVEYRRVGIAEFVRPLAWKRRDFCAPSPVKSAGAEDGSKNIEIRNDAQLSDTLCVGPEETWGPVSNEDSKQIIRII